jgi:hypothetical protein
VTAPAGLVLALVLAAGCAAMTGRGGSAELLSRADGRLAAAEYRGAIALYDEFLRANPDAADTPRARATRAAVERLILAQAETERLRREVGVRDAEVDRLRAEVERLRGDLQRLRTIDLRQLQPPQPQPAQPAQPPRR